MMMIMMMMMMLMMMPKADEEKHDSYDGSATHDEAGVRRTPNEQLQVKSSSDMGPLNLQTSLLPGICKCSQNDLTFEASGTGLWLQGCKGLEASIVGLSGRRGNSV